MLSAPLSKKHLCGGPFLKNTLVSFLLYLCSPLDYAVFLEAGTGTVVPVTQPFQLWRGATAAPGVRLQKGLREWPVVSTVQKARGMWLSGNQPCVNYELAPFIEGIGTGTKSVALLFG